MHEIISPSRHVIYLNYIFFLFLQTAFITQIYLCSHMTEKKMVPETVWSFRLSKKWLFDKSTDCCNFIANQIGIFHYLYFNCRFIWLQPILLIVHYHKQLKS